MNNKIIGFTISKKEVNHEDVDIFNVGLSKKFFKFNSFYIYFWGWGDLDSCSINNIYSLSFPLSDSLGDSNVIIEMLEDKIIIKNDWLGSIPVFYSKEESVISTLVNKVVNKNNLTIDEEGMDIFLNFGYSVLGKTIIKGVSFLRFYSEIVVENESISIFAKEDNTFDLLNNAKEEDESTVIKKISDIIKETENKVSDKIIIPTSGGYDSRILNLFVKDKNRVESFTYGTSFDQNSSYEVKRAQFIADKLGVNWRQIYLSDFNKYYKDWFSLYGCSTHLHGMYHIEFYKKIAEFIKPGCSLFSGIIGDAWSGNVNIDIIESVEGLDLLGYSHGIHIPSKSLGFDISKERYKKYFLENKEKLENSKFRIIESMRFKIILLSYLMKLPDYFGFLSWSPFLNKDIALSMLKISEERRKNRIWQKDFFVKEQIDVENLNIKCSYENVLDFLSVRSLKLDVFSTEVLSNIFSKSNLSIFENKYNKLSGKYPLVFKRVHNKYFDKFKNLFIGRKMKIYYVNAILKAVELSIEN